MRSRRQHGALLGVAALTLGLVAGSITESAAEEGAAPTFPATGEAGSVTLITGDRVVLNGSGAGSIVPAANRDDVAFSMSTEQEHVYVIPSDARDAIDSGRVDKRLFDVTELMASHYDDANRDSVPLILTTGKDLRTAGSPVGTTVTAELPTVRSFAAQLFVTPATM